MLGFHSANRVIPITYRMTKKVQLYDCDGCHHVGYCERLGKTNCPDYHPEVLL